MLALIVAMVPELCNIALGAAALHNCYYCLNLNIILLTFILLFSTTHTVDISGAELFIKYPCKLFFVQLFK